MMKEELMKRTAAIIGKCIVITLVVLYLYVVGTFYLNHIFKSFGLLWFLGPIVSLLVIVLLLLLYSPVDSWCDEHFTIRSSGERDIDHKVIGDMPDLIDVTDEDDRILQEQAKYQALAAKKARGFKLGNPEHLLNKHKQALENSAKTCKAKADNNPNNKRAVAMLRTLVNKQLSLKAMADTLNREGFVTSQGCSFTKSTVQRIIKRYNLKSKHND
jgi:hypothetical protein